MGSRVLPSGLGPGSPCASVSARFCCPGSHGAVQGTDWEGHRVALCWVGAGSLSPRAACFPASVVSCRDGSCPPALALSRHGVPLGTARGSGGARLLSPRSTGASLTSATAFLQIARLAWEPLQPLWAAARKSQSPPFSLLGPCKEKHCACVCPLLSALTLNTCDPQVLGRCPHTPSNSPTPAGCLTIQLSSETVYLEVVSDPAG